MKVISILKRAPKRIYVIVFILATLLFIVGYQYLENQKLHRAIEDSEDEVEELDSRVSEQSDRVDDVEEKQSQDNDE